MAWPMRSAFDPRQRRPKNPKPKGGPDLCADCEHERKYHNAVGCGIPNCWCAEFTRTATANHCACQHNGRGELTNECQEHLEIREQRDELLTALRQVESEMQAGFGSSFGETREQVRRAIARAEG